MPPLLPLAAVPPRRRSLLLLHAFGRDEVSDQDATGAAGADPDGRTREEARALGTTLLLWAEKYLNLTVEFLPGGEGGVGGESDHGNERIRGQGHLTTNWVLHGSPKKIAVAIHSPDVPFSTPAKEADSLRAHPLVGSVVTT